MAALPTITLSELLLQRGNRIRGTAQLFAWFAQVGAWLLWTTGMGGPRLTVRAANGTVGSGEDAALRGGDGIAAGTDGGDVECIGGSGTAQGGDVSLLAGSGVATAGDVRLTPGNSDALVRGQVLAEQGISVTTTDAQPAAAEERRGQLWIVRGGPGVADVVQLCVKTAGDAYAWKTVTLT